MLRHTRLPDDKASILDNEVAWDRETFDLTFWGAYANIPARRWGAVLDLYFLALDEDDHPARPTRDRHLFTPAVRLLRRPATDKLDFELEAAYQFGTISTDNSASASRQDVSAYFVHAELGRRFRGSLAPRLSLEYDIASGDGPGGNYSRFDTLFGSRRSDFGPTGIYGPLSRANIESVGVRLELERERRWDASAAYRAAWLAEDTDTFANTGVRDPTGSSGSFAGHQLEARAGYWIWPSRLRVEAGGALLFQGRFLREAPNSPANGMTRYGYVELSISF